MEFGSLLSRAFQIVRQHRVLWILGFLAALAGAGGGGGVPSTGSLPSSGTTPGTTPGLPSGSNPFPQFNNIRPEMFQAIAGIAIAVACVLVLISIVLWVIGTIANAASSPAPTKLSRTAAPHLEPRGLAVHPSFGPSSACGCCWHCRPC